MDLETNGRHSIHFQLAKATDGTSVAFCDSRYNSSASSSDAFRMGSTNAGGWESSYMRNTIMPQMFEAMPEEWQNIIYECTKYTDNYGREDSSDSVESHVTATKDKMFLPATYELGVKAGLNNTYEFDYQEPYAYLTSDSNRTKYKHNETSTTCVWWERSPYLGSGSMFYYVNASGSGNTSGSSDVSRGLAPCFVIA